MAIIGAENVYGPAHRFRKAASEVRAYENVYSICAAARPGNKAEKEAGDRKAWMGDRIKKTYIYIYLYKGGLKKGAGQASRCAWLGRKNVLRVKAK